MAENQFVSTVEALFKGMDQFVTTKTVVGDAVKVDDAIILPLVDVTCGMAAGSFADNAEWCDQAGEHQAAGCGDQGS